MLHSNVPDDSNSNSIQDEIKFMRSMGVPLYAITEFLDIAEYETSKLPIGHPESVVHLDPLIFRTNYPAYFN